MSSFASLIASAPTPQPGKRKKGPNGDATQPDGEESMTKLLAKVTSIILTEQRNQASRIGHTLLLPAEHELTIALTATKGAYAAHQPAKEPGKSGQKHPWGAPRNVNTAIIFETTIGIYMNPENKALVDEAVKIWCLQELNQLTTKVVELVSSCTTAKDFSSTGWRAPSRALPS